MTTMIGLEDPVWGTLIGGYRLPYDASIRLRELEGGSSDIGEVCQDFWDELHHQGDVDLASYAAVPHLVRICIERWLLDWNTFALVAVIEKCRIFGKNPTIPGWIENDYHLAVKKLAEFGAQNFSKDWPKELTQSFLAVAAFAKGSPNTGRMLIEFPDDEMKDVFEHFFA